MDRLYSFLLESRVSDDEEGDGEGFWFNFTGTIICVILAALASGLTIGLLSLDPFELRVILETDPNDCTDEEEKRKLKEDQRYARKLLPVITKHHFLLVTLLLLNSMANETMPLFLDSMLPRIGAIVVSVTFVLVFGEILPSAIFTGPHGLRLASYLTPLVFFFMAVLSVLSYPISLLLDHCVGVEQEDNGMYSKARLKAFLRLQVSDLPTAFAKQLGSTAEIINANTPNAFTTIIQPPIKEGSDRSFTPSSSKLGLTATEYRIAQGAMSMAEVTAKEIMTPIEYVYMLSDQTVLTLDVLASLVSKSYSRIPIYKGDDRSDVRGILFTKKLMAVDPNEGRIISSLVLREPMVIAPALSLSETLHEMQRAKSHLALVSPRPDIYIESLKAGVKIPTEAAPIGICTIMDLVEKLMGIEDNDRDEMGVQLAIATPSQREALREKMKVVKRGNSVQSSKYTAHTFTNARLLQLAENAKKRVAQRKEKESKHEIGIDSNEVFDIEPALLGEKVNSTTANGGNPSLHERLLDDAVDETIGGYHYSPPV